MYIVNMINIFEVIYADAIAILGIRCAMEWVL